MITGKVFKFITFLFLISIPSTFVFWVFFSDVSGVDDHTEKEFAKVLNERFEEGDIVFPENEWDLGFLQYINPGITSIYLTLKDTSLKDLGFMKEEGGRIFFLMQKMKNWEEISHRTGVKEIERITAGSGFVVIGSDGTEKMRKEVSFVRDIGKAKEVWFSKEDKKMPCVKSSQFRWQCSRDEWNYVGTTAVRMGGKTQKAIWAHPKSGMTLHLTFDIPAASKKMVINTAFLETAYRSDNKAPVEVEILLDGRSVIRYTNKSESRMYAQDLDIADGSKEVEIRFFTENDGQRHFVFNGYLTK